MWKGTQGNQETEAGASVKTKDQYRKKGPKVWGKAWTTEEEEAEGRGKKMTGRWQGKEKDRGGETHEKRGGNLPVLDNQHLWIDVPGAPPNNLKSSPVRRRDGEDFKHRTDRGWNQLMCSSEADKRVGIKVGGHVPLYAVTL